MIIATPQSQISAFHHNELERYPFCSLKSRTHSICLFRDIGTNRHTSGFIGETYTSYCFSSRCYKSIPFLGTKNVNNWP